MDAMVRLTRIYTKTGDDGTTGLSDGSRVSKSDSRIEAYGTVDELNAVVGLSVCSAREASAPSEFVELLEAIQHDLFDLGADLATPGEPENALRVTPEQGERLEKAIDRLNADLEPLSSFVLPGGSEFASWLHLARTVCRRAERAIVTLAQESPVGDAALIYINRLSDFFFVLARRANSGGSGDVLWIPGKNRKT